jgi:hypothetical protein
MQEIRYSTLKGKYGCTGMGSENNYSDPGLNMITTY